MRRGSLSDLFTGVAAKRLTLVETISPRSNQHEFQGTRQLRRLLGDEERKKIPTRFIWMSDEQEGLSELGFMSWSNVRKGKPRAPEYHLYYSNNPVTSLMREGDFFPLALASDGSLLVVITPGETLRNQLVWLFGLDDVHAPEFQFQDVDASRAKELDFAARYILDELGIDHDEPEAAALDRLIERFGFVFPSTRVFSELARSSLPEVDVLDDPDAALLAWMEREEQLFRRLERRIVSDRIASGFAEAGSVDVEGFLSFSLSVHNRRKSRTGHALENHLEALFLAFGIRHSRGAETENRNRPDFLFPGGAEYHDPAFARERLAMLGAKSTLKDRWRQVLSEAEKIEKKHLLTLEPGISENQTDEMNAKQLQLVVPRDLHSSYRPRQADWLMNVSDFLAMVRTLQA